MQSSIDLNPDNSAVEHGDEAHLPSEDERQMAEVVRGFTAAQQDAYHRALNWWAEGARHRETLAAFCVECGLTQTQADAEADAFLARREWAA
jgi:membrane protease subunit (stomatin/prohibitin family)